MKLGLIGAGTITQAVHLPAARRLSADIRIAAIHDLSPARTTWLAEAYGARPCAMAVDILNADDVDAVLIATPGSHTDLTRRALGAGKHVLAEKPLTLTIADAVELAGLARDQGLVLQVGYMKMFDPVIAEARRWLPEIGELRHTRVTVLHPEDRRQTGHLHIPAHVDADSRAIAEADAREVRATERALGVVPTTVGALYRNVLNGSLIHELSVLRALGLTPPVTFAHAAAWPWPAAPGEPPCILAVAQPDAATQLELSWNWVPGYPRYFEEVTLLGTEGRIVMQMAPPYLLEGRSSLTLERRTSELSEASRLEAGHDSGFVRQLQHFARAVAGRAPVMAGVDGVIDDLRCLQALAALLAARQGVPVGGEAGASVSEQVVLERGPA